MTDDEIEIPDDGEWHHFVHHKSGDEEVVTLDDEIVSGNPIIMSDWEDDTE